MKRIIPFLVLFLLMVVSVSAAPVFPHNIYGYVSDGKFPVRNLEMTIESISNDVKTTAKTNVDGLYGVDLGNIDPEYRSRDVVRVTLDYCKNLPQCVKEFTVGTSSFHKIDFDISGESYPDVAPEQGEVVKFVCSDGLVVITSDQCPREFVSDTTIINTVIKFKCSDGKEVSDENSCEEYKPTNSTLIIAGIGAIILALSAAWSIYKNDQSGLKGKYKWIPGFTAILKIRLTQYQALLAAGKFKEAKKLEGTLMKYIGSLSGKLK